MILRAISIALLPTLALAQVQQGAPNADFAPAFQNQTRAPALAPSQISVEVFSNGLDRPWGIAPLPGGQFLVTERGGALRLVSSDGAIIGSISGVTPVRDSGQGGLLDIAVSPGFTQDRLIFWTYAKSVRGGAVTAAARGELGANGELSDVRDIFVQTDPNRGGRHFGSRILPMADGTVWITTGDRGEGDGGSLSQQVDSTIGKVIRVKYDGGIPADNPFENEVWSLGHRNMQGAAIDTSGRLWTIEHGPAGGDELNRPIAGGNYGWPFVSYGVNYSGRAIASGKAVLDGTEQPVYYWDPVIAPAGMTFYDGPFADWRGDLLIGSLNPGGLVRLKLSGERVVGEERLLHDIGRVRDVEVLSDGRVLLVLDSGQIIRILPE